jgi:hypothetical protein
MNAYPFPVPARPTFEAKILVVKILLPVTVKSVETSQEYPPLTVCTIVPDALPIKAILDVK